MRRFAAFAKTVTSIVTLCISSAVSAEPPHNSIDKAFGIELLGPDSQLSDAGFRKVSSLGGGHEVWFKMGHDFFDNLSAYAHPPGVVGTITASKKYEGYGRDLGYSNCLKDLTGIWEVIKGKHPTLTDTEIRDSTEDILGPSVRRVLSGNDSRKSRSDREISISCNKGDGRVIKHPFLMLQYSLSRDETEAINEASRKLQADRAKSDVESRGVNSDDF